MQDFGTTFSSVAYAFTHQPDQIYAIDKWPGSHGSFSSKCPALIRYDELNGFKWGFEVDPATEGCIEGTKLFLDSDQPRPPYAPAMNTETEVQRLGKSAVEIALDYVAAMIQHTICNIESKYPSNYINMLQKQYIISVPATWSNKTKSAIVQVSLPQGSDATIV